MKKRVENAIKLGKCIDFGEGKVMLIGHGCIGSNLIPLLLRHSKIKPNHIIVVDQNKKALDRVPMEIKTIHQKVTEDNYIPLITKYLKKGDVLIDLAYYLSTEDLIKLCNEKGILFINTAVENWIDPELTNSDPRLNTLYSRQLSLQKVAKKLHKSTTSLITHGANPGWVSHFVKEGLVDMALYKIKNKMVSPQQQQQIKILIEEEDYPKLSKTLGVKVIHISERDSQTCKDPRPKGVFRNTWSIQGFVEEGAAPAELGWGTHENSKPGVEYNSGLKNQICLRSRGINTWVKSWVPSGPITGMMVRHEEAFSISKYLTVDGYRPTVHYVYLPCDDALTSLAEIQNKIMVNNHIPDIKEEILNQQIEDGVDELGVLLFSEDLSWWRGSLLDIHEARLLVPGHSATSVQVAISVLAGMKYILENPKEGLIHPEAMDHLQILDFIESYLGPIKSIPVTWKPTDSCCVYHRYNEENPLSFENFVISYYPNS